MKQAFYKSFFVILFLFIIALISGTPASKACDKKAILRKTAIKKESKPPVERDEYFPDLILGGSIFQI